MSGRYYYCIVKATVGSSTATTTSTPVLLTVKPANYSILKSGKTTFYNTIDTAISAAVSGGGDSGGGTIKVLNTITDNKTASTNKTITIDTNGKTLTREQPIITTGGTLTIEGSGTIYCSADSVTLNSQGGNLTISSATIRGSSHHAIYVLNNTKGNITINSSYVYSNGRSALGIYGTGDINITSSWIYTPVKDKNALLMANGSTGDLTIKSSVLGNGRNNTSGADGDNGFSATISYHSTGKLTINSSRILAGSYAAEALTVYKPVTINLTGSTSLYAANTSSPKSCIRFYSSGATVTFNSTGYFYCTDTYVADAENYKETLNVTKGNFVSRNNKYMFYNNGAIVTSYASNGSAGNRTFQYMDSYKSTSTRIISNCYYYGKGV